MAPRKQTLWATASCAVAAAILDFNHAHLQQTADSLMPVLNSLMHWTPFFWGQNYYGMLWPFLAQPVHHPLANFLLQNAAVLFMGLAAHFAVARYLLRRSGDLAVGALSAVALLALTSPHYSFTHLGPALFYTTPLVLGILSLVLVEAPRPSLLQVAGSVALMALSCWFNSSAAGVLGVLAVGRHGLRPQALWRQVALCAAGTAWGYGLMRSVELPGPKFAVISPALWPQALAATARSGWEVLRDGVEAHDLLGVPPLLWLLGGSLAAAALLGRRGGPWHRSLQPLWPLFLRTLGMSAAFALLMCTQHWAQINDFSIRYWYPVLTVLQVSVLALAVLPLVDQLATAAAKRQFEAVCCVAVPLCCIAMFGAPSLQTVRQDLQGWAGVHTPQLLASRANFMGGDYWKVWPGVFHANLTLYERGESRRIWGMANKAAQALAAAPPAEKSHVRIFVPRSDVSFFVRYGLPHAPPLALLQRNETFDVLGFAPAP
jgi:hypothetical protein